MSMKNLFQIQVITALIFKISMKIYKKYMHLLSSLSHTDAIWYNTLKQKNNLSSPFLKKLKQTGLLVELELLISCFMASAVKLSYINKNGRYKIHEGGFFLVYIKLIVLIH